MSRQPIDGGGWFDLDSAKKFSESARWDGKNHISDATGSQWDHESLYVTRRGVYVLNHWSQWQGSGESWERIDTDRAAEWLTQNGHDAPDGELSESVAQQEV